MRTVVSSYIKHLFLHLLKQLLKQASTYKSKCHTVGRSLLRQSYLKQYTRLFLFSLLTFSLLSIPPSFADEKQLSKTERSKQVNAKKLNEVLKAIAQQEANINKVSKDRKSLEQQLKNDDLAISKVAKAINDTNKQLADTTNKIIKLNKQKQQLTTQKKQQENLLAKQLRAAYTTGQHDYLKLLLNQEKTDKIQRTISYYQYFNNARITQINTFKKTLTQLQQISLEHQKQIESLQLLKDQQNQQRSALKKSKKLRNITLQALNKKLLSTKQQLTKLKSEETNLATTLKQLEALALAEKAKAKNNVKLTGLSKLKRKLTWPVKGRITHRFGSKKQGYLKWKGVLMKAPIGRQVQTIHNGTILFSDWLKGYGLVTVVDHGNGYMSLYAHNQTLLKSVGDRVETGEPIALVGQSGGQEQPGLYFEIRYRGNAVNPKLWCK